MRKTRTTDNENVVNSDLLTVRVQLPAKSARPRAEDSGQRRPRFQLTRRRWIVMTAWEVSSRMAAANAQALSL